MITGGCHCGAIRYQAEGEALVHALCHCTDCRRHAGAPMVGWTMMAMRTAAILANASAIPVCCSPTRPGIRAWRTTPSMAPQMELIPNQ